MLRSTAGIRSSDQSVAFWLISSSICARCASTPSTKSTVYSGIGGSAWASRVARVSVGFVDRRSDSYRTSSARFRALLRAPTSVVDSAEVATVAGVHLDLFAGGDEQRHLDRRAGLELRGLGATG